MEIWQALLGIEQVGIDDNFFDLGGHSLLMAQLRSRLEEQFEVSVPLIEMFQFASIRLLAERLKSTDSRPASFDREQDRISRQREAARRRARPTRSSKR